MPSLGTGGPPETIPSTPGLSLSWDELSDGELIGQGGNADVYRVTVTRDGNAVPVAIKQPRFQGTLHTDAIDRFRDEVQVWYQLDDHDHIVSLFDGGTDPLPWLAMEYMDGGNLQDLLNNGGLPAEQALWVGYCICQAVHYAHRHGVAHHDLKPANILFRQYGENWMVPKVSDWGLARMMLDETGSVDGLSPHYSAPEQFDAGKYGSPNDQTDIYQIGTVLYELLTGKPPFEGSMTEVMQSILSQDPAPPSSIVDVPAAVDEVVMPALKKEQAARYDSIVYLRDGLKNLLDSTKQDTIHADGSIKNGVHLSDDSTESRDNNNPVQQNETAEAEQSNETTAHAQSSVDTDGSTEETQSLINRRSVLAALGVGAVYLGGWQISSGAIDSPFSNTNNGGDDTQASGGGSSTGDNTETNTGRETESPTYEHEQVQAFLNDNDANLYGGELEDMTGQDEVVIETGAGDNGFSFSPPGAVVSTGTNVVWEWTGNGGAHNVVSEDGSDYEFESELTDQEGYTIEQTVDEAGAVFYVCVPHRAQGMYGAVAVIDDGPVTVTVDGGSESPKTRAKSFVSDNEANLYRGSLEDMTGQDEVVIETGAGQNGFSFNSPGMVVSTGTTIVWEWTGNGGAHNVVSEDGSDYEFESELTDEEGYTIEQTVDEAGAVLYVCVPHRAQGMYGAVAAVDE